MNVILNSQKIQKFLVNNRISLKNFAVGSETLKKVLDRNPVHIRTAEILARAMGVDPLEIILKVGVPRKKNQRESRDWWLSK